jgi:hypothetical protein
MVSGEKGMSMTRKIALALVSITASASVAYYLLTLPLLLRLPQPSRASLDGVTTIDDAVEACRRSHLHGWELVAYAQHLVAHKFTYSRLNPWDTPARAFERGLGYCQQQALSLQQIYDRLGIRSTPVFAPRCLFPPKTIDGMPWPGGISGHVWLRVRVDGEERDICPGSVANTPEYEPYTPGCAHGRIWHRLSKISGETQRPGAVWRVITEARYCGEN